MYQFLGRTLSRNQVIPPSLRQTIGWQSQDAVGDRITVVEIEKEPAVQALLPQGLLNCLQAHGVPVQASPRSSICRNLAPVHDFSVFLPTDALGPHTHNHAGAARTARQSLHFSRSKQRRSNSHNGCSLFDGTPEITRHSHGEFTQIRKFRLEAVA